MNLTKLEKETIILSNEKETVAEIYTFNKKLIRKIRKANATHPELFKIKREDKNGAIICEMPKDRLGIRLILPQSEDVLERQKHRMKKLNEEKKISRLTSQF